MSFNRLTKPKSKGENEKGVYTDVDSLSRLQVQAMGFDFLPRQPIHSLLAGKHASRLRGRGLNFEEIRGYVTGDDIRNMDWKVTARMRKPHVRVFTEERDRPVLLVVDQRMSMFFGSQRAMKSVAAAEAAALAAWRVLSVRDRVGAVVFNDSEIVEIRPHCSRNRVMEILGVIERMNRKLSVHSEVRSNPSMFNEVLKRVCRLASHDFLVCLIGDGTGSDEETSRHLSELSQHNDLLSVFVFDPLEVELPAAGRLVVAESASQLEVNTADKNLRERYRHDFENRLAAIQQGARQREIPLLQISTAEAVAFQVRRQLGHVAGK